MNNTCLDSYNTTFSDRQSMLRYHQSLARESQWQHCKVNELHVEPLDKASPLYSSPGAFAAGISEEAVADTAKNLGLALLVGGGQFLRRLEALRAAARRAE